MKAQLGNLMQQAQRMQDDMKRAQEELAALEVSGQAGGGMVKVQMGGGHDVRRVTIDRQLFAGEADVEMIEDLIAAACNDAVNKIAQATQSRMGEVTAGMSLPPGFKLPF